MAKKIKKKKAIAPILKKDGTLDARYNINKHFTKSLKRKKSHTAFWGEHKVKPQKKWKNLGGKKTVAKKPTAPSKKKPTQKKQATLSDIQRQIKALETASKYLTGKKKKDALKKIERLKKEFQERKPERKIEYDGKPLPLDLQELLKKIRADLVLQGFTLSYDDITRRLYAIRDHKLMDKPIDDASDSRIADLRKRLRTTRGHGKVLIGRKIASFLANDNKINNIILKYLSFDVDSYILNTVTDKLLSIHEKEKRLASYYTKHLLGARFVKKNFEETMFKCDTELNYIWYAIDRYLLEVDEHASPLFWIWLAYESVTKVAVVDFTKFKSRGIDKETLMEFIAEEKGRDPDDIV